MEWLIEALRVVREVRDWTTARTDRSTHAEATHDAVERVRVTADQVAHNMHLEPIGPAKPPRRETRREKRGDRLAEVQEIPIDLIDPHALSAVRRLKRFGHKAYLVGGCVRDLLLGLEPKDFDVATDARPEEVKSIFRNSRIIGRRFRLVHLYFRGGKIIEVSTFRAQHDSDEESEELLIRRDNVFGSEQEDALSA